MEIRRSRFWVAMRESCESMGRSTCVTQMSPGASACGNPSKMDLPLSLRWRFWAVPRSLASPFLQLMLALGACFQLSCDCFAACQADSTLTPTSTFTHTKTRVGESKAKGVVNTTENKKKTEKGPIVHETERPPANPSQRGLQWPQPLSLLLNTLSSSSPAGLSSTPFRKNPHFSPASHITPEGGTCRMLGGSPYPRAPEVVYISPNSIPVFSGVLLHQNYLVILGK